MISEIKRSFKILKYAHGVKAAIVGSILLFVLGIAVWALSFMVEFNFSVGYFFALSTIFVLQLMYSVNYANLVQASPVKRRLQTSVFSVMNAVFMLGAYLFNSLMETILILVKPEMINVACKRQIFLILLIVIISLYASVCYKAYLVGSIIFVTTFAIVFYGVQNGLENIIFGSSVGEFAIITGIGIPVLLVGFGLGYLLTLAVYRRPMSKYAQNAALRSQM